MPVREEFLGGIEEWRETAEATNTTVTATHAAEAGKKHFVTGFSISASAAPAASVLAEIRQNVTTRRAFRLANAAFTPIIYEFRRALEMPVNTNVDITLPALGAGVIGRVEIVGFTRLE